MYYGKHQPIVSKKLWDSVQDKLEDKGRRNTKQQKHNWPFQGLVQCGHCGCAMVAEIKNGKYVYYHCTGNKGKCPEKFVRQEELARQFGEGLKAIQLDEPVIQWVVEALKASHDDEKRYHNEMIEKLQAEYNRLQARLDAMYTDKLDGRISQEFYDQKYVEWRREQEEILRKTEAHQNANESYIEEGIKMLELANRAYELYIQQPIENTRTLLDYVYSNCSWKGGKLALNYRKPFDLIVEMRKMRLNVPVDNLSVVGQNENWLPLLNALRHWAFDRLLL